MTKDLTEGKTLPLILNFSIPILGGYLFQQFYNVVDTVIVGKCLGVNALAAVGSTGSINFLIIGFCVGLCSGFAIPIANSFGAKNYSRMRKFIYNSEILSIIFALVLTVVTVIFCRPLLIIMQTPLDILDQATSYIRIIFAGIPFIILFNMGSCILRAIGNSKTPLFFLIISSVLNIFLDLIFIMIFHLDVAGAALATIVSQGLSGAICFFYIKKKFSLLELQPEDRKLDAQNMRKLCGVGVPMGLQYSITAIGTVILQISVNTLGSAIVAAASVAQKLSMFFCTPFDAVGTAMATYGGQNVGAGKLDRLKSGILSSTIIGFVYSIFALIFIILFGKQMGLLFIDHDEIDILKNITLFLIYNAAFYFPLAILNSIRFLIQGMGFSSLALCSGILEMIARTVIAIVAVPLWGYIAVCMASPVAWILADIFLIPAFFLCLRLLKKKSVYAHDCIE
ncbi:MAG: MATE family efflux transporter [Spirochaetales bacterium]|nr:MATE family efflux transporter [Spirochaetales bacterium]